MPERFSKINDFLYRGGRPSKNDLKIMKDKFGIKKIVSLDGDVAKEIHDTCKSLNLDHIIIPIDGSYPEKNIDYFINNINTILNPKIKTYIHCFYGRDRTSMACAIFQIINGMSLSKALKEATNFGMGEGLPDKLKKMYYDVVVDFAKEMDINNATIVEEQRDETIFNNINRTMNLSDMNVPYTPGLNNMSFAPYSSDIDTTSPVMNTLAANKTYIITDYKSLLKPGNMWGSRTRMISHMGGIKGNLYSAEISSDANIISFKNYFNKTLLQTAKLKGADVVFFAPDVVFVINPNALINIQDEGDSNQVGDAALNVGQQSNYDGLAPYSFPGSGGIMESGYGGFGGIVQLPYTKV